MYQTLALLGGVVISVMAVLNGTLTAQAGLYLTTVIIHLVAVVFALAILKLGKQSFIPKDRLPLWMYCGGAIGVQCTLCSNYAYGKISLVAITALGLLAQTLTSLLIDRFGLFGAKRYPIRAYTWACIIFSFGGIAYMLHGSQASVLPAIAASLAAGAGLALSRVICASLARSAGAIGSSLINHLVGAPLALLLLLSVGRGELSALPASLTAAPAWAYLGGIAGVLMIVITNVVLERVSAFQVSLLLFAGQVFSGAAVDLLSGAGTSQRTLIGGITISAGLVANSVLKQYYHAKDPTSR